MQPMNLLSSRCGKHRRTSGVRRTIGIACSKHGYVSGDHCPRCSENPHQQTKEGVHLLTNDWVKGYWEHLGPTPVYIESKAHLFSECRKRGLMPRAFMKPSSQGKGFEIARR